MAWLPIKYRDFYDMPRAFILVWRGKLYFFDCPFSEEDDDYPNHYTVYQLPLGLKGRLDGMSWENLAAMGQVVGRMPARSIKLDPSKRQYVDEDVFDHISIQTVP